MRRRDFVRHAWRGSIVVALGAAAAWVASRFRPSATQAKAAGRKLGDEFRYDVSAYQTTDPALVGFDETRRFDPGLRVVRSIASGPEDKLYVAGEKLVRTFDAEGAKLADIKPGGLPRGLAVTDSGELYVGVRDHLEVYSPGGTLKAAWDKLEGKAVITAIAVAEHDVFVADAGNRAVWRYDRGGKLLGRIGEKDESRGIPGFVVPSPFFCVRLGGDGLLHVANPGRHRIETYTFEGELRSWWGKPSIAVQGFCGCCNPVNFDILPDGRYVTCEKGLPRVKVYDREGNFQTVVAGPEQFPEQTAICNELTPNSCTKGGLDVALDAQGRALVLDVVARQVLTMTARPNA